MLCCLQADLCVYEEGKDDDEGLHDAGCLNDLHLAEHGSQKQLKMVSQCTTSLGGGGGGVLSLPLPCETTPTFLTKAMMSFPTKAAENSGRAGSSRYRTTCTT